LEALEIVNEAYEKIEGYNYSKGNIIKEIINELNINNNIK